MRSGDPGAGAAAVQAAWAALAPLTDPEIPVVSLQEMGILRDVRTTPRGLEVVITPTYSGCPAMDQIRDDVSRALKQAGLQATVTTQLSPAWTTDWIGPDAREKLRAYGIAPPGERAPEPTTGVLRFVRGASRPPDVPCPRCGSKQTTEQSAFGSTACKALYRCLACQEPFDHFKPL
jgi:ring-1,2-phenylacetyl-CoA epoxidase subunit PaaD